VKLLSLGRDNLTKILGDKIQVKEREKGKFVNYFFLIYFTYFCKCLILIMIVIWLFLNTFLPGNYLQQHYQMEFCEIGITQVAN